MSRGYGRSKRGFSHASFQFDKLFKENSNKPSAARSAGVVGKWGITSFTSIRSTSANGYPSSQYSDVSSTKQSRYSSINSRAKNEEKSDSFSFDATESKPGTLADNNIQPVKPKKFFKSRNVEPVDDEPKVCSEKVEYNYSNKRQKPSSYSGTSPKATKKFFPSKRRTPSPKRDESKPPIVLRICRGKSRLLSDSDESESTLTPSSVTQSTVTSPRNNTRAHSRVTRSTSKVLHDSGLSPATAETPTETFSALLSPEYIPPEKFELERKAMYENLLGPSSPKDSVISHSSQDQEHEHDQEQESASRDSFKESQQEIEQETETSTAARSESVNDNDDEMDMDIESGVGTQDTDIQEDPIQEEKEDDNMVIEEDVEAKSTNIQLGINNIIQEPKNMSESSCDSSDSVPQNSETVISEPQTAAQGMTIEEHRDEIMEKILEKPAKPPEPPVAPVKLVISKKKGSIFKSRAMVPDTDGGKKRRALYKHKWCSDDRENAQKSGNENPENKNASNASPFDDEFGFEEAPLTRVTNTKSNDFDIDDPETITSVKCTKKDKEYYTVVRNVKKAHQIQEIGEFQEFNDDVEYILDALQQNNPIATRCLSAISLATKCMVPAFRMHVRAHGVVAKFFKALGDATKDQSLGLCTATVMFVLSQDRLNMDLDRDCLELMLNLLESDVSYQKALDDCGLSSTQLHKNKAKVREICAEMQNQGHAMHLNLDNITVGQLAMETLLSLTSKRAGEWFKEELRELGGLQHIMETICECCRQVSDYVVIWTDVLLDKLRKVDRCMRVLENVTHNNEANQTYLLQYNNGVILDTLVRLYRLCDSEIPLYPVTDITDKESKGTVIREALLVTLKVLINLTHHFSKKSKGSALIGSRPGIIDSSLHLLLQVPHHIPEQKKFELGVLVLMLLINLIQDNDSNKKLLIEAKAPAHMESIFPCDKTAIEALIEQFYICEEMAKVAEKRTNAILDGEKDTGESEVQPKSHEEFIEETVAKLLQKAGSHMEYTFIASYIVMLIGFLIMDNKEYETRVRQFLKGHKFTDTVEILKKFFNFMNLTASTEASSVCQIKTTERVIKYMEQCDATEPNLNLT